MNNKISYLLLGLIVIFGILVLILALYSDNTLSEDNIPITTTTSGGSFENPWLKFDYPSELTLKDSSDDKHVKIEIYNGTKYIGTIFDESVSLDRYGSLPESNLTTVNGRKTLKDYDYAVDSNGKQTIRPSAAIYLTQDATLNIILEENRNTFNQMISTLNIKKEDTHVNPIQSKENRDFEKLKPQTGGSFENQWIKFSYPQNYTVNDASTADHIQITISNETGYVGEITATSGRLKDRGEAPQNGGEGFSITITDTTNSDNTTGNITTIAGRNAKTNTQSTEDSKPRPSALIELNPDSMLELGFQPGSETAYNQVISSLTIKNDNIHPSIQGDIYYYLKNWYNFFVMSLPF
jgi:hypothetical protein